MVVHLGNVGLNEDGVGGLLEGIGVVISRFSLILALVFNLHASAGWAKMVSTWNHNGSLMSLELVGNEIRIEYAQPRAAMYDAGARPGSLLFHGQLDGSHISGTARIFVWQCGEISYPVEGEVSSAGNSITLKGRAPVVNRGSCVQKGEVKDVLSFDLRSGAPIGSVIANQSTLKETLLRDPSGQLADLIRLWKNKPRFSQNLGQGSFEIDACAWSVLYESNSKTGDDDRFLLHLSDIAGSYVRLSDGLEKIGYPRSVWERPLVALTNARVSEIVRRLRYQQDLNDYSEVRRTTAELEKALARALNEYRNRMNPALTKIEVFMDGMACGGDYVGYVKLATQPVGGRIRVIKDFYFKLCGIKGISPYSSSCDLWTSVGPNDTIPFGLYHYMSQWSDQTVECDRIDLAPSGPPGEPETRVIVRTNLQCTK